MRATQCNISIAFFNLNSWLTSVLNYLLSTLSDRVTRMFRLVDAIVSPVTKVSDARRLAQEASSESTALRTAAASATT